MGIESTYKVKRNDAIVMLLEKNIVVNLLTNEEIAELLYKHRESIFENYIVIDSLPADEERIKEYW